jgi:hypothetical protein
MLLEYYDVAQQEIALLLAADEQCAPIVGCCRVCDAERDRPNIVRYYAHERDDQFVYLALARCEVRLVCLVAMTR